MIIVNEIKVKRMKRNISRIKAMVKLYQLDLLNNDDNIDLFDELLEEYVQETGSEEEEIVYDHPFSDELFKGVKDNLNSIDRNIALALDNYSFDRLSYVDRALLRIGTYELMFTKTPIPIVINEIINISKDYSEIDKLYSSKFNNGVLDKIAKKVKK